MKYEVEIKSLLGKKINAEKLVANMTALDPKFKVVSESKQLNHYFLGDNIMTLYEKVEKLFPEKKTEQLRELIDKGDNFSVRSRQKNDEVLFIIKASVDDGTSFNTVSRMEFEEPIEISLDELDRLILTCGYQYQAKWSRERVQYRYKNTSVCLDKNAGYGYLAEFEKVIARQEDIAKTRKKLLKLMTELNLEELPQDRLERMFNHYNANWFKYYGTNRTFTIE